MDNQAVGNPKNKQIVVIKFIKYSFVRLNKCKQKQTNSHYLWSIEYLEGIPLLEQSVKGTKYTRIIYKIKQHTVYGNNVRY